MNIEIIEEIKTVGNLVGIHFLNFVILKLYFFLEKNLKYSDVRDEKRIFGIMNLQKKSRDGNEKRIFKRI